MKKPKIVVIGGGTGTFTVLMGLKKYPVDLSVIVSMMDSGGSNRVIRDEFGLLPTSDIRQCITALAGKKSNDIIRNLFTYRYSQGTGISGMTFGNLFMAALTDIYGSQEKAIEKTSELLRVEGKVLPVTFDNVHLIARYENGTQVLGEHAIDEPNEQNGTSIIVELSIIPEARVNVKALQSIKEADLIVLGPGDLYTSIICNLIIDDVSGAIARSRAKKLYVVNLMTKFGQTNGFGAREHIDALEKYLGKGVVDIALVNKIIKLPTSIKRRYVEEHAEIVKNNIENSKGLKVVEGDFASNIEYHKSKSDKLVRSLVRHDSDKLAKAIMKEV
ncbi:YvcK family protein [Candidatus Microgenomates bacterium]|nr:MAG: YvcK family protein [Candidatus Microgenomates bacterium]